MKKVLFIAFALLGTLITSCGTAEEGQKVADKFFQHLAANEYESAGEMIEVDPLNPVDQTESVRAFANHPKFGAFVTAEKGVGFNSSINNGISTVKLPYNLKFEQGEYATEVTIVDRGEGFKISYIE